MCDYDELTNEELEHEREIIRNNKLIAKFLGWHYRETGPVSEWYWQSCDSQQWGKGSWSPVCQPEDLAFHASFDWLMIAIEKVESLGFYTNSDMAFTGPDNKTIVHFYRVYKDGYYGIKVGFGKSESRIESIYIAIIDFIEWKKNLKG